MILRCLEIREVKIEIDKIPRKQFVYRFSLKIGEPKNHKHTACILEFLSDFRLEEYQAGDDYELDLSSVNNILEKRNNVPKNVLRTISQHNRKRKSS